MATRRDLDGLEDGSGTDDELAWMSMLVESSAAALNESLLEEEEGGGDEPGAGSVLHLEASRLDASIRTREAALQQLVRTRRALHDACTRENQVREAPSLPPCVSYVMPNALSAACTPECTG